MSLHQSEAQNEKVDGLTIQLVVTDALAYKVRSLVSIRLAHFQSILA